MSGALAGRTAVVTGGARNIGRQIVLGLVAEGAAVVINAQNSGAEAEALAEEIRAGGGRAIAHLADVTSERDVTALATAAATFGGGIDILVNNAAIRRETSFETLDYAEWRQVLAVILDGAFLCSKAMLPHIRTSTAGVIVNIGGLSAHTGSPGRAHVVAAKAGLAGLTRAMAHDLAPDVTVNCVVPGVIDTVRGASTGGTPAMHSHHRPLVGRRGRPEEVAALVCFLCGPNARYLTGQTMHANGGAFLNA